MRALYLAIIGFMLIGLSACGKFNPPWGGSAW